MPCSQVYAIFILHITLTTTCGVEECMLFLVLLSSQTKHMTPSMTKFVIATLVVRQAIKLEWKHVVYVKKVASFLRQDAFGNC